MNKSRQKQLDEARGHLEEASAILCIIAADERTAYDNLPSSLQSAPRGEAMDASATALEGARDNTEAALDDLGSIEQ